MVPVSSSLVKVRGRKLKPISIILFLSFVLLLFTPSFNSEGPKDSVWDTVPRSTKVDLNDVISLSNGSLNGTSAIAVGDGVDILEALINVSTPYFDEESEKA